MRPVITPAESARLDATADVDALMGRAGLGVALEAVRMGAGYGTRVAVLAGPGNNGGDGYVAARHLRRRGVAVEVLALSDPRSPAAINARASALAADVRVGRFRPPGHEDLVIDAVFGGGFRGEPPAELRPWMESRHRVLAVDVPSGLDPLTGAASGGSFRASRTVTFHAFRTGHLVGDGPDLCGEVVVVDIGLSGGDPTWCLTEAGDAPRPERPRTGHKWSVGSVLVIGGATGMVGAAVLAGRSALAFGAGAAGVATPDVASVQAAAPDLLAYPLDGAPSRYRVVVVGPGLGSFADAVVGSLAEDARPLVVDADALGAVTPAWLRDRPGPTVCTPHADEFRRLTGEEPGPEAARRFAADTGCVVLLKGNPTFVTDGSVPWVVTSNGPELATIGTGDVLAGMIAALIGRGLEPVVAARSAAHWHGVAGADLATSGTVTADRLADTIRRHAWETRR